MDVLGVGRWLDERAEAVAGFYRPSLMVEIWVTLLFYGGGWLEDLELLRARGIRRLFGWARVPDPTTLGRWLRRAGKRLLPVLEELTRHLVRQRWAEVGVPGAVTLVLDSTVVVRYGKKQAGAEVGYNPKKPGRPSHHPLLAVVAETGDLLGIRWRGGSAHTAAGAQAWIEELVGWLRAAGVEEITVRLDKGFYAQAMVKTLEALEVFYVLKIPNQGFVRDALGTWRLSVRGHGIFPRAETVYSAAGRLWGARLLSLQGRRPLAQTEGTFALDTHEVTDTAHVLTNIEGIHAITAWRLYNAGAVVEQRIEELGQLSLGKTAIDDRAGNALLWALGGLAYQLFHTLRHALYGHWRRAQPKRLRAWLFRTPGRFTTSGRQSTLEIPTGDFEHGLLPVALAVLGRLRAPPLPA